MVENSVRSLPGRARSRLNGPLVTFLTVTSVFGVGSWLTSRAPMAERGLPPVASPSRSAPVDVSVLNLRDPLVTPPPKLRPPGAHTYILGDRLKIAFYERLDLSDDSSNARSLASNYVERTELGGEYLVQQDGNVVLPLVGTVAVAGMTIEEAVSATESAFRVAMRREGRVSLLLVDREPIYIVGDAARPGTFKHSPGMTVLHAMAVAGGAGDERGGHYIRTEYLREQERQAKAIQRIKRLLPQWAVLSAEREGASVTTPPRLLEIAGSAEAARLMRAALHLRTLVLASRKPLHEMLRASVASARRLGAGQENKLALVQAQIQGRVERREVVSALRSRGNVNVVTHLQSKTDVAALEERRQDVEDARLDAQLKFTRAEGELRKLEAEQRTELERDLATIDAEIADLDLGIESSRRMQAELRSSLHTTAAGGSDIDYEVTRRGQQGATRFAVTDLTELLPGDLLRVNRRAGR